MAVIKGKARQTSSTEHTSEGADVYLRLLRDGSASMADIKFAGVMEGRGFQAIFGAFSTGTVGTAATVIDVDEPQAVISVPSGTSVIPMYIATQLQHGAPADGQESELLWAVDQDAAAAGASATNFTAVTIYNMNTLFGRASGCTAWSDSSDSYTDPTLDLELCRKVVEFDVAANGETGVLLDHVYEPSAPFIINGPAQIVGYWGGDAIVIGGFAQVQWLEFPSTYFA